MRGLGALDAGRRQLLVDLRYKPVEPGLIPRLSARDKHVLRIRGAKQPPAVVSADPNAVGRIDLRAVGGETVADFLDD